MLYVSYLWALNLFLLTDLQRQLSEFVSKEAECLHDENSEESIDKVRNGDIDVAKLVENWAQAFTDVRVVIFWRVADLPYERQTQQALSVFH